MWIISWPERLLNFVFAYCWVGPLVTVYWCNSWHLPENYFFPTDPVTSSWISGAIGYTIYFLCYFLQDQLAALTLRQNNIMKYVIIHAHTYAMCWGNVNQWRCTWILLDEYTGVYPLNAALTCAFSSVLLLLLRCHRTIASSPSTVRMDLPVKDHFKMITLFEVRSGKLPLKMADSLFTTLVVDTSVIGIWRGLWEVLDLTLEPDDKTMSATWTLVISYGLAILLFITMDLVKKVSILLEDKHWIVSLIFEDFVTLCHSVVTICHWRGFWTFMDVYLPFKPVIHWILHLGSFFLLAFGLTAISIPVSGCLKEGKVEKGEGVMFDHYYFTHMKELWNLRSSKRKLSETIKKKSKDEIYTIAMSNDVSKPD